LRTRAVGSGQRASTTTVTGHDGAPVGSGVRARVEEPAQAKVADFHGAFRSQQHVFGLQVAVWIQKQKKKKRV